MSFSSPQASLARRNITAVVIASSIQGHAGLVIATLIGTSITATPVISDAIPFRR